jgi:type VI secretion system protein ImpF
MTANLDPEKLLLPSLLWRLTDDSPETESETASQRGVTLQEWQRQVVDDLRTLLSTPAFASLGQHDDCRAELRRGDSGSYPEVAKSVLNYGIPALTGVEASSADSFLLLNEREKRDQKKRQIKNKIEEAIRNFEPRIGEDSLKVVIEKTEEMSHGALTFHIEGDLWPQPLPSLYFYVRSEMDVQTGRATILDIRNDGN